jgi:transposase-like protein
VTEACRTFGISRTTYYRWAGRAQRYGLAALLPKGRRPPVMPTATPPEQVEAVLAEAVARPTLAPASWSATSPAVESACRRRECRRS